VILSKKLHANLYSIRDGYRIMEFEVKQ